MGAKLLVINSMVNSKIMDDKRATVTKISEEPHVQEMKLTFLI